MEASAFEAPVGLTRSRVSIGVPLLRLRSDEQLVALFREGHDDAFRVIHDRYHKRLLAYMRQMLPRRQDAEDALQEVFMRAYFGLRAHDRNLSLRAWLFRVAHNRCIDELRRPAPPPPEILELLRSSVQDPVAEAERRESLRRLIADVRRLPDQQRSALLMRELGGMSYADLAASLDVSVPAVKSLLVRARVSLARAAEARDTACSDIREALVMAHDQGVRPGAMARRHIRDCTGCRSFRRELRGMSRGLAALAPSGGPIAIVAKLLSGSGGAGSGAGGGSAALGAVGAGGSASSAGIAIGANHVVALIATAVATGGAMEIQHTIVPTQPAKRQAAPAKSSSPVMAVPDGPGRVMVYTSSGQVVVVPESLVAVPPTGAAPSSAGSATARHSSKPPAAGLTAVTNGSASAATAVDNPPGYGSYDTGTSNPASSTAPTSTPAAGSGSVASTGSGSSDNTSGSTSANGSGSTTSGSTTTSLGGVTTGSTSGGSTGSSSPAGSSSTGSGSTGSTGSGSSSPSASSSSAGSSTTSSSSSGTTSGSTSSGSGTT